MPMVSRWSFAPGEMWLWARSMTSRLCSARPARPNARGVSSSCRTEREHFGPAGAVCRGGLPLAYEVLSGNTSDKTTLRDFLARIERQYGKARRVWLMDRGIPTEEVLAEMRQADPPVQYLVG